MANDIILREEPQRNLELDEKKEWVVDSFQSLFDKKLAYDKCSVTEEERAILDADKEFQERLQFYLIQEKEFVIKQLRDLADSENDATKLRAVITLGKIVYPERFSEESELPDPTRKTTTDVNVKIQVDVHKEDYVAEVLGILEECGAVKPKIKDSSKPTTQ